MLAHASAGPCSQAAGPTHIASGMCFYHHQRAARSPPMVTRLTSMADFRRPWPSRAAAESLGLQAAEGPLQRQARDLVRGAVGQALQGPLQNQQQQQRHLDEQQQRQQQQQQQHLREGKDGQRPLHLEHQHVGSDALHHHRHQQRQPPLALTALEREEVTTSVLAAFLSVEHSKKEDGGRRSSSPPEGSGDERGGGGSSRSKRRGQRSKGGGGGGGRRGPPAPSGLQRRVVEHLAGGEFDEAFLLSVPVQTLNWCIKVRTHAHKDCMPGAVALPGRPP